MEILDILNEDGKVIGSKDRKQIYIDGDLHRTVHIWVINSNKEILMQKRSPKKDTFPNLWALSTAGHIKSGDSSIETALRELKEELGIKVTEKELIYLFSIRKNDIMGDITCNTIDDVYLVNADLDCENTKLQFSELTDIKYVYYEYLEQILKNKSEDYVPMSEEHTKLFKYLHDLYDDHDEINVLYKTETENTYTEYSKFNSVKFRYNSFYLIITLIPIIFLLNDLVSVMYYDYDCRICIVFVEVLIYFGLISILPRYLCEKRFNTNKILKDSLIKYVFYENYFTIKTKQLNMKVYYADLYQVYETNNNYYLLTSSTDGYIILKNNIDTSFNSFIKNKIVCKYYKHGKR